MNAIEKVKRVLEEAEHDWYGERRNPVILGVPMRGGGWINLELDDVRALLLLAERVPGKRQPVSTVQEGDTANEAEAPAPAPAPAKRKYNMSPEGKAARSERMKEYWRKRKGHPE